MDILILSSSANKTGLTADCVAAAANGARQAGCFVEEVSLKDFIINSCHACNNGWGTCRTDYYCVINDDFNKLHERFCKAQAYILITPVYWGDMSESMKSFTDRLRRCEASRGNKSTVINKRVIAIAAAGGSGRGTITCLANLERLLQHLQLDIFDLISITRRSRDYRLTEIQQAAAIMIKDQVSM